jgi:hypothetical protein
MIYRWPSQKLKKRYYSWAKRSGADTIDCNMEEEAWLAGFRAGKKEGYNNGLKEGLRNHELYNEPLSDKKNKERE